LDIKGDMASLVGLLLALFAAGGLGTYILKRFVIDPIREYRNVRKEISRDLVDYANLIANPGLAIQIGYKRQKKHSEVTPRSLRLRLTIFRLTVCGRELGLYRQKRSE